AAAPNISTMNPRNERFLSRPSTTCLSTFGRPEPVPASPASAATASYPASPGCGVRATSSSTPSTIAEKVPAHQTSSGFEAQLQPPTSDANAPATEPNGPTWPHAH